MKPSEVRDYAVSAKALFWQLLMGSFKWTPPTAALSNTPSKVAKIQETSDVSLLAHTKGNKAGLECMVEDKRALALSLLLSPSHTLFSPLSGPHPHIIYCWPDHTSASRSPDTTTVAGPLRAISLCLCCHGDPLNDAEWLGCREVFFLDQGGLHLSEWMAWQEQTRLKEGGRRQEAPDHPCFQTLN